MKLDRLHVATDRPLPFMARVRMVQLAWTLGRIQRTLPHPRDVFRVLLWGRTAAVQTEPEFRLGDA